MKFGIFYELQLPRPWEPGDEHRLYQNALTQVELADRLVEAGFRPTFAYSLTMWLVEKAERGTDPTSSPTRSAYRKALQQLWDSGYRPRPGRLRVIPGLRNRRRLVAA